MELNSIVVPDLRESVVGKSNMIPGTVPGYTGYCFCTVSNIIPHIHSIALAGSTTVTGQVPGYPGSVRVPGTVHVS